MTHPNKREIHTKAMELNRKRKEANREILRRLTAYLEANPDQRFNQALVNLYIIHHPYDLDEDFEDEHTDNFYIEPDVVLKRMK